MFHARRTTDYCSGYTYSSNPWLEFCTTIIHALHCASRRATATIHSAPNPSKHVSFPALKKNMVSVLCMIGIVSSYSLMIAVAGVFDIVVPRQNYIVITKTEWPSCTIRALGDVQNCFLSLVLIWAVHFVHMVLI
jgi:hypothetical protein